MTSTEQRLRRLQRIEVEGLFGIYDHAIDLELDSRVTLLHGPNGVGKTTILKMIDALLTENFGYFRDAQFKRLLLRFDDGTELQLDKDWTDEANPDIGRFSLITNGDPKSAELKLVQHDAAAVADEIDFLVREGRGWIDIRDGERLADVEVLRRYGRDVFGSSLPAERESTARDAEWLPDFLGAANSHFIEAQRLARPRSFARWPRRREAVPSRVVECSRELKRSIDNTMADYGRQAQALDQTFPRRMLLDSAANDNVSVEEIRSRMSDLQHRTDELKNIGILDDIHQLPPVEHINSSQAGVMALYVNDTAQKLKVLEGLASHVRLLLDSLNSKFRHKEVRVDRNEGLVVAGKNNDLLPLDSLSSGEQHELILHYDLLFRVPPNTVVLLDEPELSLHIAWQRSFLSDLMDIVQLSRFDALVATHSPHIVGDRDDLMVELAY